MFAKRKRGIISLLLALFMLLSPIQALFAENAEGNTAYGEQAQDLKDIGEGSDHLTESEKANPVPIIEDNKPDPYLGDIAPKGLRSRGTQLRTPNPGAVELSKTVEAVPGKLNTFKVTLRMEATDREQKNDIVLVIDTSGSMKDNGRMEKAKEAAISFVNRLLDAEHPNTRIALVSFESKAYLKKNFTNYTNKQALIDAINALKANGGTFTQGGIKQAEDLLSGSQADFKNIVLLSDGVPTFNYAIDKPDNYLVDGGPGKHTYEKQTGPNVPKTAFLYGVTYGAGNSMWWKYWDGFKGWKHYYYYYNSGNCAIAEASFAKNSSTLYTVAVEAGNQGNSVLNQMASPNCAYTANPAQLTQIFNQIAARIASAMKNANVTDPMGAGFEVKGGNASNVQVSQGSVTLNNNTISWNVGTLTESVPGNPLTRFAEMTYEVEVNDSILGVVSASGQYNTNAGAQVSYIDIDGNQKTKNFPEPTAEPLLIGFYKQVLDSQGKPVPASELGTRKFTYNMKLNENGSNKDYTVAPGTPRVMTDLRIDKDYTFKETAVSGNPASQLSDYETSVKWETFNGAQSIPPVSGTTLNNFVVPKDANNKPLNTRITVTNKEKADGKLTIEKKLNTDYPLPRSAARGATRGSNIPAEFKFTVKGVGYDGSTVVYENNDVRVAPNQSVTLENLPYGTYTVTEVDVAGSYVAHDFNPFYTVGNLSVTGSDLAGNTWGKVKISIDKKNRTMTVTNTPMSGDAGTEFWAIKKWSGGPAADHGRVNWELYADGVLLKDGDNPLQPSEIKDNPDVPTGFAAGQQTTQHMDGATAYVWKNLKKYKEDGSPIVYTVKEAGETADHKITVNGNEYSVSYAEKKDISYKDNEGIYHNYITQEVTNAYIQPTNGEVTVTKVWQDPDGKTLPKPEVNLTLYRKVEGGAEEQVPAAEAEVKVVNGTTTTAKWTGLKTKDINGKAYSFIVKESFKNAGHVNNDNWTLVSSTDVVNGAATITNTAVTGEANLGKLTVTKKPLVNGQGVRGPVGQRGTPLKFSFKVTGPAGYEKTFELAATESKVLTGLYFGEYKVEETNTQGYTATYSVADGKVTLKAADKEKTVEVTNTNGGQGTVVDKTIEKVWENGPKPSVTLELWRKNNVEGTDKIDEKVDGFVVPENASGDALKKTFTNLAKHDPKGNEYEYYVKEDNVPANYTKAIDGLKVTNTYTQPSDGEVAVTKVWQDPDGKTLPKPEVNLTLYRKVEGGAEEQVPIAEAAVKVVDGTTTTAKWTGLKTKDINGKAYSFIVKESFKNAGDVNNDNWTLVESTDVVNGAATITNKAVSGDDNLGKLTVTKKPLVNGQGVRGPVGQRGTPLKFSFKVTGPAGYEKTFELAATESKVLTGLYFGEYKVEETDSKGYTATYSVADGKVTLKAADKEKTVEVTNTNGGQGTVVDKTIEKVWVNGPKPSVTLELWRKNNVEGADKIDEKVDEFVVPANASGDALKKTFTKLAKHDSKGNEYEYYVKEDNVPANYTKAIDGLKVTNTYTQPSDGEVTVTKVWKDPDGKTLPKPEVNLTLYRKVEGGAEEQVPEAEAAVKVVNGTTTTAKWENLKTTDKDGKTYSFIVKESFKNAGDVNNDNWTLVSSTDVVNGAATIKNEALVSEADLGKLTVTKKPLVNGQGVRGPVGQRGTPIKFSFKVTGPAGYEETFELEAGGEPKELKGLYFGEYKVEETNTQGYTASYAPGQTVTLRASAKTATIEVTNTNGGQGTVVDKTIEKVWVNGPKPSVTLELWRKNNVEGTDKIDEKVDGFVVPENASGDALKKTFTNLAKHDPKGNEYEYYVKEDNVPANYTKNIEGLKVTNTYTQPSDGEVAVTKVWQDPDGKTLPKPEVNLTLYRKVEGGAEEQVPAAEAEVKVVDGTTTTAKWTGLKTKDINGNAYSFIVKESFKNAGDVNNDNWTLVSSTDVVNGAATITNKAVSGDDNLGKLTVTKKPLVNGQGVRGPVGQRGTPLKFSFKVTGHAGYEETFELAATESKVLTGLYFGEYKVEETNTQGYTPSYAPGQTVTLRASAKTATIEVTNTNGGDGTVVDKTVEKVWVNGPKPDTVIQLWRKGTEADGTAIDEKVGEFTANGTKTEETFANLAKHDPKGNEFEYYVKEDNVPANYTKNIEGLKVTNTYTQPQGEDIIATKTWENAEAIKPEIKFELWRKNGTAGDGEKVVDAKALVGDTVNFGKQLKTDINGVAYTYFVKEVFTKPEERDNWIITGEGEGLTVNNKLKAEAERDGKLNLVKLLKNEAPQLVSVIKSSRGGSQLEFVFKVTGPYGFVREIKLKAGESITLENLSYGQYKVEETNSQGFAASYDPANGEVMLTSANRVATVTVTNTNDGGNVENVTPKIIKIWVNGPKPATKLELWRRNNVEGAGAIDEKVNEFMTTAGENSQKEFTLTSANIPLAKFDPNGYEFEYYAKEPNVPADYMVNVEGLKVTNTYKGSSSQNKPIPKTGDSYTSLPLVLVIVSMLSLAGVTVLKKKRLQK